MPAAPDFPPAPDQVRVQRALISIYDKADLLVTAQALHDLGVELVSTGGTKAAIAKAGLPVKDVADLTGFPEMMDGRVKTLHPVVHGGLPWACATRPSTRRPWTSTASAPSTCCTSRSTRSSRRWRRGGDFATCIENIDIGGPAMIRSASKNHGYVAVCTGPEDMAEVIEALKAGGGCTTLALRKTLAARAFSRTASYDSAIASWFAGQLGDAAPRRKTIAGALAQTMRYGENPHQSASFYVSAGRAWPPPASCRARSSPTTTSPTPTPPSS